MAEQKTPQKGLQMDSDAPSGNVFDALLLRRLYRYVRPYPLLLASATLLTVLAALFSPLRPYLVKLAVDNHIAIGDTDGLMRLSALFLGVLCLEALTQFGSAYLTQLLGQKAVFNLRQELFAHVQRLALSFFDRNPIGRLMTRITNDVESLNEMLSSGLVSLLGDVFQLAFIIVMMLILDWQLTLVSFSVLPLMFWATMVFKKYVRVAYQDVRTEVARLNAFLQEHITGMMIVQLFSREQKEFEKHSEINAAHRDANIRSVWYYSIFYPTIELLSAIALGLIIWHSSQRILSHSLTLGVVISFVQYIALFFRPLQDLSDKFNIMQTAITSAERIFRLLDQKVFIRAPEHPVILQHVRGDIAFENVSFAYTDENWVLRDISFEAKAGEKIALVGATGSGKSTIISLLSKFYEPQKGRILLDGIDIRQIPERELRRHIGVVLQDVFLFSGTIRDNITLGNAEISDAAIDAAARLVGAHTFIEKLPRQYDYLVQERGSALSAGQRQLIAFVRALVYDPKILVLDEATSSVHTETEQLIERALEKLMAGRTALIIAHRLSTVQKADKIIVLHRGTIREMGTHQALLQQRGLYYKLYQLQYAEQVGVPHSAENLTAKDEAS